MPQPTVGNIDGTRVVASAAIDTTGDTKLDVAVLVPAGVLLASVDRESRRLIFPDSLTVQLPEAVEISAGIRVDDFNDDGLNDFAVSAQGRVHVFFAKPEGPGGN